MTTPLARLLDLTNSRGAPISAAAIATLHEVVQATRPHVTVVRFDVDDDGDVIIRDGDALAGQTVPAAEIDLAYRPLIELAAAGYPVGEYAIAVTRPPSPILTGAFVAALRRASIVPVDITPTINGDIVAVAVVLEGPAGTVTVNGASDDLYVTDLHGTVTDLPAYADSLGDPELWPAIAELHQQLLDVTVQRLRWFGNASAYAALDDAAAIVGGT
jgi:hypothetical protein